MAKSPATRRLVITADDFGLAPEVNQAIEDAHRHGVLSATSLMVGGPAATDAVDRAGRLPTLRVGLHLALVEAQPLLSSGAIPDLVGRDGWFRRDTARYGAAIFFRPAMRRQIEAEIEAQFAAFARTGLTLDHVNAHQHFHLHPTVASAMVRIGLRYGMRAVRVPHEPIAIIKAIDPSASATLPRVTAPWTVMLGRRLRKAGLQVPDQVFGLAFTGAMTGARIDAILRRLPRGLTEIYTHPAIHGGFRGAAPGYRYAEEFSGLLEPRLRAAITRQDALLGGFMDGLA